MYVFTEIVCAHRKNVVILHSEIRNKCWLVANQLDFHHARCFARCSVKRKKEVKLLERIPKDAFGIEIV